MRWRWALGAFSVLLIADTVTKALAPDSWVYEVSPTYWLVIVNPHEGLMLRPGWEDLLLLAFLLWPATRLAAAVVFAGSIGNMAWSWAGGVPNIWVSNGADGIGWLDRLWTTDTMVSYNIADLCLRFGIWALFISIGIALVRSLYELATGGEAGVPDLAGGGTVGTPAGDEFRDRLGAGSRKAFPRRA